MLFFLHWHVKRFSSKRIASKVDAIYSGLERDCLQRCPCTFSPEIVQAGAVKGLISWVMAGHELESEACVSIHGKRRAALWPTLLSLASDLGYLDARPDLVNTPCELVVHSCTRRQSAECHVTLGRSAVLSVGEKTPFCPERAFHCVGNAFDQFLCPPCPVHCPLRPFVKADIQKIL